jgi:hypothetical protein
VVSRWQIGLLHLESQRNLGDMESVSSWQGDCQSYPAWRGYCQEATDGRFIYYQKPITNNKYDAGLFPEIWRVPRGGGPEEFVVNVNESTHPAADTWFWRVTTQGIYFIDNSAKPHPLLKFFSFASRMTKTVRQLDNQAWGGAGLAVSPDGQAIWMSQVDNSGSDIFLVENFH